MNGAVAAGLKSFFSEKWNASTGCTSGNSIRARSALLSLFQPSRWHFSFTEIQCLTRFSVSDRIQRLIEFSVWSDSGSDQIQCLIELSVWSDPVSDQTQIIGDHRVIRWQAEFNRKNRTISNHSLVCQVHQANRLLTPILFEGRLFTFARALLNYSKCLNFNMCVSSFCLLNSLRESGFSIRTCQLPSFVESPVASLAPTAHCRFKIVQ